MGNENAKHTPGEWKRGRTRSGFLEVTACGGPVATVSNRTGDTEGEANACLIAAAPDLLAMLIELERKADALARQIHPPDRLSGIATVGALEDATARARVVIAKAMGTK